MNKTEDQIIKSIQKKIYNAVNHFKELNFSKNDIRIYVPESFREIFIRYNKESKYMILKELCGVIVLDGYEDKIIISVVSYVSKNIKPIKIKIRNKL